MARSSQIRSIERREGISIAELVIADMAMGNPAYLLAQSLWTSFPRIHIAQFPFQVIGNRGLIALMQCSNRRQPKILNALWLAELSGLNGENDPAIAGWR